MGMMSEFKEFTTKGNAVDMAVGIVIGHHKHGLPAVVIMRFEFLPKSRI